MDNAKATDDTTFVMTTTHPTSVYSGADGVHVRLHPSRAHLGQVRGRPQGSEGRSERPHRSGRGRTSSPSYKQRTVGHAGAEPALLGPHGRALLRHYDKIVYVIYNNEDSEAAALQNGEIDFGYFNSGEHPEHAEGQAEHRVCEADSSPGSTRSGSTRAPRIQTNPTGGFTPHGDGAHALTDPVVRRAIRQAVDDQTIVDKVLLGYGIPADSPVQPTATTGEWNPPPEQALAVRYRRGERHQLDAAGYTMGSDGVRDRPVQRQAARVPVLHAEQRPEHDRDRAVREGLADARSASRSTSRRSATEQARRSIIEAGDVRPVRLGLVPQPRPELHPGCLHVRSAPARSRGSYQNSDSYYCNPKYDKLYEKQLTRRPTPPSGPASSTRCSRSSTGPALRHAVLQLDSWRRTGRTTSRDSSRSPPIPRPSRATPCRDLRAVLVHQHPARVGGFGGRRNQGCLIDGLDHPDRCAARGDRRDHVARRRRADDEDRA